MYACASNCLVSGSSLSEQNPTNSQYMDYVMSHVYNVFPREGKMNKKGVTQAITIVKIKPGLDEGFNILNEQKGRNDPGDDQNKRPQYFAN